MTTPHFSLYEVCPTKPILSSRYCLANSSPLVLLPKRNNSEAGAGPSAKNTHKGSDIFKHPPYLPFTQRTELQLFVSNMRLLLLLSCLPISNRPLTLKGADPS